MNSLQGFAELGVAVLVEWVEVRTDSAGEEDWVLGNTMKREKLVSTLRRKGKEGISM